MSSPGRFAAAAHEVQKMKVANSFMRTGVVTVPAGIA
jgi:hypothetical protein